MSFVDQLPGLRNLAERDRRAVVTGLAILLPVLLWYFAARPYRSHLRDVQEHTVSERALLQREQELIARAATLPDAVAAAESDARRAEALLVRAPNTPLAEAELTSYLQSVATFSHVLLKELRGVEQRRTETFPGDVKPIRLSVSGESDLDGVITFFNRVETSPLLIRIREVQLEPQTDGQGPATGVMQFTLLIEAFAPAEPAAVQSTAPRRAKTLPEVTP